LSEVIKVTILNDTRTFQFRCEMACGEDWSSADARDNAAKSIKERFGSRAKLEYIDLAKTRRKNAPELKDLVKSAELVLPALLIDGRPRITGSFDLRQMLDMIDAEKELLSG
jgi:hypothetical protein